MTASTVPTRHGAPLSLEDAAIDELGKAFDGELVRPTDEAYDRARRPWNGMIDRCPALVVRPRGTADVVAAIRFARRHGLEVAVRCGGHGVSGQSVTDGGIVIDLGLMRAVRVAPTARRAWVQGGCLLSDVDREAQLHGLATTGGVVSHTGVGGLTLGGGYGYLARRFGLACDNVLSAEVVTAAGDVLLASPDQNDDLFWGIRGGGGNFGVVTGFEFRLHPFGPDILSVDLAYPLDDGPAAIRALLALAEDGPDALLVGGAVVTARPSPELPEAFHGAPVVWGVLRLCR
jgi:FAD/FMN-containing dehydrogenase